MISSHSVNIDASLNQYLSKGYAVRRLPNNVATTLDRLVASIDRKWEICEPDDQEQILRLPLWNRWPTDMPQELEADVARDFAALRQRELALASYAASRRPRAYDRFFDDLVRRDAFFQVMKTLFRLEITDIQLWDGVGAPYWHWDGPGNGDIYMLLYLTDHDEWPASYGGTLKLGVRELTPGWLAHVDEAAVQVVDEIRPSRGTMVISDNRNPRVVHHPVRLTDEAIASGVRRLTFLVTFKARL